MKILLTTLNSKYIHSSLALRYLEAYCRQEFSGLVIQEYTINDNPAFVAGEIYKTGARVVGFSCYIWNITQTLAIAAVLKKVAPETIILLGGPEVSYDPEDILNRHPYIDFVISGEGEMALLEFLKAGLTQGNWEQVPSLSFRRGEEIISTPKAPLIKELSIIPSPYQGEKGNLVNKIVYYESSRGCPFDCQYCLSSTIQGVRFFSLERVIADLTGLIEAGAKQVKFVDRTFNCRKEHALDIMRFLAGTRGKTTFHFEIAADLLDQETLEFLAEVPQGLFQFEIGVQSTNRQTLELISRKMNLEQVKSNLVVLHQKGNIHLHLDLIAGLPGEDYQSFRKSFNDVYAMEPQQLQLGFLKLLKGSGIRLMAQDYGIIFNELPPYEVLKTKELSYAQLLMLKAIEDLVEKYYNSNRFRHSLKFILKTVSINPFDLFEKLAFFWLDQGHQHLSHGVSALHQILAQFYETLNPEGRDDFLEILKFDYLLHEPSSRLPQFIKKIEIVNFQERVWNFLKNPENIKTFLPQFCSLPAKEIIKKVRVEAFNWQDKALILFDYSNIDVISGEARYQVISL